MKKVLLLSFLIRGALFASSQWMPLTRIGDLSSYSAVGDGLHLVDDTMIKAAISNCGTVQNGFLSNLDVNKLQGTCMAFLNAGFKKGKQAATWADVFWSSSLAQQAGFVVVGVMAMYGTVHAALALKNKLQGNPVKQSSDAAK